LIEGQGVGEAQGGVGYAEVEMDAPTIGDLDVVYGVCELTLFEFQIGSLRLTSTYQFI
jgi:hypothetical protein